MLVRLILWLIFGFLVYTMVQVIKQHLLKPPPPPPEKTARGEEMVKDPECGTYVPKNDAIHARIKGKNHYFCSTACRDQYQNKSAT